MGIDVSIRAADGTLRDVRISRRTGAYRGVRPGAIVGEAETAAPAGLRVDVVGGPDSGRSVSVGRASITVGRDATCTLQLTDPDVSRRHVELRATQHGVQVCDLGSRNGTQLDGMPLAGAPVTVAAGQRIRIGDSVLSVATGGAGPVAMTRECPDGTIVVSRPPQPAPAAAQTEIVLPRAPDTTSSAYRLSWLAALVPALLGGGLALVLGAPQFAMFALLSPIAALVSAGVERHRGRRSSRAERARYARERAATAAGIARRLAAEAKQRHVADPDAALVLRTAQLPGTGLWRVADGRLGVRLGLGDDVSQLRVRDGPSARPAGRLPAVPIVHDLAGGPLGVTAPAPVLAGIGRWLIAQLCTAVSPADLRLALLLSPRSEPHWRWARWLPHLAGRVADTADAQRAVVTELTELAASRRAAGEWSGGRILVVLDRAGKLGELPGLAALLSGGAAAGITALCLDEQPGGLPACCAATFRAVGETGTRFTLAGPDREREVVADRVSADWAEQVARALAPLRDAAASPHALPDACRLLDLLDVPDLRSPLGADAVRSRWAADDGDLRAVLGVGADGAVTLDLARDGPHALVAGTTGAGKSELLRTWLAGLAACHPPDAVAFVLVDYKGGAAFAECASLPHTVGMVTDLDAHLAARALRSLTAELEQRERLLAAAGVRDWASYRASGPRQPLPRLVIMVDEFAELAGDLADFVTGLVGVARRGRSLGVHLVLATQRPGGVVSAEIRANTAVRIALRVTDPSESREVLDTADAALISRRTPGRSVLRIAGSAPVPMQAAHLGSAPAEDPDGPPEVPLDNWRRPVTVGDPPPAGTSDLAQLVATVTAAAGTARPRGPWLPPLPAAVPVYALPEQGDRYIPWGLLDLPDRQAQRPLYVDLEEARSLLVVGGPRSGRTSALLTLAVTAAHALPPEQLQLFGIDCGGGLGPLRELPHCGGLLGPDPDAVPTLLSRLTEEVERRRGGADRAAALLLLVDGWEALGAVAEEHGCLHWLDALVHLVRAGPAAGLTIALAGGRDALAPRLSGHVGSRLLLQLPDRADYALAGLPARAVPAHWVPGRAVRAEDGVELQLAHLGDDPAPKQQRAAVASVRARWGAVGYPAGAVRVAPLPHRVCLTDLPSGAGLLLGVGGDAAEPIRLDLFTGQGRLLVAGPPRSGRSTVLTTLLAQLAARAGTPLVAAPPHSPLARFARDLGVPVIGPDDPVPQLDPSAVLVDDSEAFADTASGATLLALAQRHGPALPVVAAADSDELAITFRGIAAGVRRSRCAVLLAPGPADGELVGVRLPHRRAAAVPGRGVLVGDPAWGPRCAGPTPVQVAVPA